MSKPGFLVYQGSIQDMQSSARHIDLKNITFQELAAELELEGNYHNRSSALTIIRDLIRKKLKLEANDHALHILGDEQFRKNKLAVASITNDFMAGAKMVLFGERPWKEVSHA